MLFFINELHQLHEFGFSAGEKLSCNSRNSLTYFADNHFPLPCEIKAISQGECVKFICPVCFTCLFITKSLVIYCKGNKHFTKKQVF